MKPLTFLAAAALYLAIAPPAMAACNDPAGPGVDWSGCNLTNTELSQANLENANLSRAILTDAYMQYANLRGANLAGADLRRADLTSADIRGADLTGADLRIATWITGDRCDDGSRSFCNGGLGNVEGTCFYDQNGSFQRMDIREFSGNGFPRRDQFALLDGEYIMLMPAGSVTAGRSCPAQMDWSRIAPAVCWYDANGFSTGRAWGNPMGVSLWDVGAYGFGDQAFGMAVVRGYECAPTLNVSSGVTGGGTAGGNPALTPLQSGTIDFSLNPSYGGIALSGGFLPDPHEVIVYAGGDIASFDAISGCNAGYIDAAQTYLLSFTATTNPRLTISVTSALDTTLAINDGQGNWICNDDSDGLNPSITFEPPVSGDYNIWVGTFGGQGSTTEAVLSISEY